MDKILLFVFLALYSINIKAQFIYEISVSNNSSEPIEIRINNGESINISSNNSYQLQAGRSGMFSSGQIDMAKIEINSLNYQRRIPIAVTSGCKITIDITNSNLQDISVTGLPFTNQQSIILNTYLPRKIEFDRQEYQAYEKRKEPGFSKPQVDSIINDQSIYRKRYLEFVDSLITLARNDEVAYYLFKTEFLWPQHVLILGKNKVLEVHSKLNPAYSKNSLGIDIQEEIEKIRSTIVGSIVKDFAFKTFDGKSYQFHDLFRSADNVLLIFTSKGCKGCKEQIPIIREIRNSLKSDIQVLYVSLDLNKKYWEDDLKVGYPGLITVNLEPYNFSVDLKERFNVTFIPQLFLINKEYKIVYDNLSPYEEPSLKRLRELLGVQSNYINAPKVL